MFSHVKSETQSLNHTKVDILTNRQLRVDINYLNSSAVSFQLSLSGGLMELQPHPGEDRVWSFQAWAGHALAVWDQAES